MEIERRAPRGKHRIVVVVEHPYARLPGNYVEVPPPRVSFTDVSGRQYAAKRAAGEQRRSGNDVFVYDDRGECTYYLSRKMGGGAQRFADDLGEFFG